MMWVTVYMPGTPIKLPTEVEHARIDSIQIYHPYRVLYGVTWWKNGQYYSGTVDDREFTVLSDGCERKVGFR